MGQGLIMGRNVIDCRYSVHCISTMLRLKPYPLHQLPPPALHFLISFSNFKVLVLPPNPYLVLIFSASPSSTKSLFRSQIFKSFSVHQTLISFSNLGILFRPLNFDSVLRCPGQVGSGHWRQSARSITESSNEEQGGDIHQCERESRDAI